MAQNHKNQRPTAGESLVNATVMVLDQVIIQKHLNRASIETSMRLGGRNMVYSS
ncbi:MAG: hypothetical protein ACKVIR_01985 [Candidatus Poseidoniales archaeon]